MQDLYKGFKKVSDDAESATLEHENGHRLSIAKSGLSRKQKQALNRLPLHQAEGSQKPIPVQTEMQPEEVVDPGAQLQQAGAQIADAVAQQMVQGATSAVGEKQSEVLTPQQIEAMPEPNATDVATGQPVSKLAGISPTGFSERERQLVEMGGGSALDLETLARQSEAEKQKEAQKPLLEEDQDLTRALAREDLTPQAPAPQAPVEAAPQAPTIDLTKPLAPPAIARTPEEVMVDPNVSVSERANAFISAAANIQKRIEDSETKFKEEMQKPENMINRDRVFDNMSTSKKIRTIIGMLLGGMSAGILRTENPVIKMLNDEIEKDVQLQQRAREEKINLFKTNLDTLKDARASYFQTTNNLRTVVELEMQDALRKLDPKNQAGRLALQAAMAENRAKIAKGNEELTKSELIKQYEQAAARGQFVEIPDELDERKDRIVRVPDQKGRFVKMYARNSQSSKEMQEKANAIASAQTALKRIVEFNKEHGRQLELGAGIETHMAAAADTLNSAALFAVQQLLSSGNISERNARLFEDIFPKAGAIKQGDAQNKAIQVNKLINDLKKQLIEGNLSK